MARPKTVKQGEKLNLYLPKEVKRKVSKMAFDRRQSVSQFITDLIARAATT